MKYLTPLLLTLFLFLSCHDGEELFYRALRESDPQDTLKELAEGSESPWNREALLLLQEIEDRDWLLKQMNRLYRKGDRNPAFLKAYRRELFLQEDLSHLRHLLEDHPELDQSQLYRQLNSGWAPNLDNLLELEESSDWRELAVLNSRSGELINVPLAALVLDYRTALLDLDYGPARVLYQKIRQRSPEAALDPDLLYWGWYGLAMEEDWRESLDSLEDTAKGSFAQGRILRFHGEFTAAAEAFTRGPEGDRSLWYELDSRIDEDPSSGAREVLNRIGRMESVSYFDDKLHKALQVMVSEGEWEKIVDAAEKLRLRNEGPVTARYLWVLARLVHHGFLEDVDIEALYGDIARRDPVGWYGMLAQSLLDTGKNPLEQLPPGDEDIPVLMNFELEKDPRFADFSESPDRVLLSLIYRGLEEEALDYADRRREDLSLYAAPFLHGIYMRRQEYLKAIGVARWEKTLEGFRPNQAALRREYPLAYRELIEAAAAEEGHSSWMLMGLIRTESAFEKRIESHAGASGLMQLIDSTAADQAGHLGLDSYDLDTPEDNLRLGTAYMNWLYARPYIENTPEMLIAYNGGPGNLRSWKQRWGHLPPEIFQEAIPYRESRVYPQLVFTGALYYGYLYGDLSPGEELLELIPPLE